MTEFNDKNVIEALMKRVEELTDSERKQLINSIKHMNTINKKQEFTEEEKAEKKKASTEKRKETMARRKAEKLAAGENTSPTPLKKLPPTDEEKAERKRVANEKRKATWARKKQHDNMRVVEDTTSEEDNNEHNTEDNEKNLKPKAKLIITKPVNEVV
tara:strand:- start:3036 stop:3509 length:474 start_codon:yes stop_codon:yes gene_type:complete